MSLFGTRQRVAKRSTSFLTPLAPDLPRPLGQVPRPVVHQPAPPLEQVRAGIGRLDPVADHMGQGRLFHLPWMIRLRPFGNTGHGPVLRRRWDESKQESGSPNDPGMIDDFHLWGSSRCCQMGVTLSEGGVTLKGDMILTPTTLLSQRAEPPRRCGGGIFRNAASDAGQHGFPASDATKRSEAGPCASPPSHGATARRTGGVLVVRATPPFLLLVHHRRGLAGAYSGAQLTLPLAGSLPPQ